MPIRALSTLPACTKMADGAVSQKKLHDIITLQFSEVIMKFFLNPFRALCKDMVL